jgi:hypothetical protein
MSVRRLAGALLLLLLAHAGAARAAGAPVRIDDFEDIAPWSAHPAEGVELGLSSDAGLHGKALRLDVRFARGTGYAVARRAVSLDLPADYVFRFRIRGEIPVNHLEFKLVDSTGTNVWWYVRRDVSFPREWTTFSTRRRQIRFAWGPAGGGEIHHVAAIELAVTAGEGGQGSVWIDDLEVEPLPPDSLRPPLRASASSSWPTHEPERALDGRPLTGWTPASRDSQPWLMLDLGQAREFGGLSLDWGAGRHPAAYAVDLSLDRSAWTTVKTVSEGNGGRDPLMMPESEARYVRLRILRPPAAGGAVLLAEATLEPYEWSATPEAFFTARARDLPGGSLPRPYSREQCAWAVVGLDGGREEALLSEDGMLETGKRMFSIEPFLGLKDRLITWADVRSTQTLVSGHLPMPVVNWRRSDIGLNVEAFAFGDTSDPRVLVRYRVQNPGPRPRQATLYLAVRPFQVNPPWQSIGMTGGTARIHTLEASGRQVVVDHDRGFTCDTDPSGFGATALDQGDILEYLHAGRLPAARHATDEAGFASGALAFKLDLPAAGERTVQILVPLRARREPPSAAAWAGGEEAAVARDWEERLGDVSIALPPPARRPRLVFRFPLEPSDVAETIRAQVGWILVNRDGPAIQPGSRNYDRSWIRDGSLTSSALLRLGLDRPVRDFIRWFATLQYDNGKVPCCASERGPDPVTENDSHGEFIFTIAEYYRYTGDRALVEELWPHVARAVAHMDSLRAERRTAAWRAPGQRRFFGLLLPSISHEGYSNPMHSYWDDFFAYRGYVDAAFLAGVLGREPERATLAAARDTFAHDLAASVAATMALHHIDYVPGCAELGDFDATSTTVALAPTDAADLLPEAAVRQTFERYWEFFRGRRDGRGSWDAFTPYEVRTIGSFVRLGSRDRAGAAVEYFMSHRLPSGWRQWAEVEHRRRRAPEYLGDLPHTWVGSDFVRSALDLFAYERTRDSTLVIAAGIPLAWTNVAQGVAIHRLRTPYGPLGYSLKTDTREAVVTLDPGTRIPPGGLVVQPPGMRPFRTATIDGAPASVEQGGVRVRKLPARVVLRW